MLQINDEKISIKRGNMDKLSPLLNFGETTFIYFLCLNKNSTDFN